jgi:hypothetical protein
MEDVVRERPVNTVTVCDKRDNPNFELHCTAPPTDLVTRQLPHVA